MTRKEELSQREKELNEQLKQIKAEQEEIYQQELEVKKQENIKRIKYFRENKNTVLSLLSHVCGSCSNDNPKNSDKCPKCRLIELLDDGYTDDYLGKYNIQFDVYINEEK